MGGELYIIKITNYKRKIASNIITMKKMRSEMTGNHPSSTR
jgi:hypothetical protein